MPTHNADIARLFEEMADLLELSDANPFRVRAYRNAARVVGELRLDIAAAIAKGEDAAQAAGHRRRPGRQDPRDRDDRPLTRARPAAADAAAGDHRAAAHPRHRPEARADALPRARRADAAAALQGGAARGGSASCPASARRPRRTSSRRRGRTCPRRGASSSRSARSMPTRSSPTCAPCPACATASPPAACAGCARPSATSTSSSPAARRTGAVMRAVRRLSGGEGGAGERGVAVERRAAVGHPGRPARGAGGELRRGAAVLHRVEGAQHRAAAGGAGERAEDQRVRRVPRGASASPARPRSRSIARSACRGSRRSCARIAARSRRRRWAGCRSWSSSATCAATCTCTPTGPTAATIREMAEAALARGLSYLAITDHSRRLTMAHGLDPERVRAAVRGDGRGRRGLEGHDALTGIEVDILDDGTLDLPDRVLAELDVVVARRAQPASACRASSRPSGSCARWRIRTSRCSRTRSAA